MEIFQAVVMTIIVGYLFYASLDKNSKKPRKRSNQQTIQKTVRNPDFLKVEK